MTVSIISRATWGARPWNGTPATVPLSSRTEFFVHWFGGVPGSPTGAALAREVERLHIDGNRWAGVGYNFIVDQDGEVFEGRGWDLQGAHCPGHNISGLGVLIAVGKGGPTASAKALSAARALYDEACRRTGRTLARRGHRDGIATECPGPDLYAWVKAGMPAKGYQPPTSGTAPTGAARYRVTINGVPYGYGAKGSHVTRVGEALVKKGYGGQYKNGPGPTWTDADTRCYAAWQRSLGYSGADADGVPGESSLRKLLGTLPGKPAPKPYAPPAFPKGLAPGHRSPSARGLQRALKAAGFMSRAIPEADNYGPATRAATARFHQAHPAYRARGLHYDPAIGPRGWAALHTIAYGKKK